MESEKTGSILQLFTGEKKKVCYNKKNIVKKKCNKEMEIHESIYV